MTVGDGVMAFVDAPMGLVRGRFRELALPSMIVAGLAAVPGALGNALMLMSLAEPGAYLLSMAITYGGVAVQMVTLSALELAVTQRLIDLRAGRARGLVETLGLAVTPGRVAMRALTGFFVAMGLVFLVVPGLVFAALQALAVPNMLVEGLSPTKALEVSVQRMRHIPPGGLWRSSAVRYVALILGVYLVNGAVAGAVQVPLLVAGYAVMLRSLVEAGPEAIATLDLDLSAFGVLNGLGALFGASVTGLTLAWYCTGALALHDEVNQAHRGDDLAERIAALRARGGG